MKNIVEYKPEYKDEVAKLAATGKNFVKDSSFSLTNEIKLLLTAPKKKKADYKIYLYVSEKRIKGIIGLDSKGKISLLITKEDSMSASFNSLVSKAEEYFKSINVLNFEALVTGEDTILFNNLNFKTMKFVGSNEDKYNFIVKKVIEKHKKN